MLRTCTLKGPFAVRHQYILIIASIRRHLRVSTLLLLMDLILDNKKHRFCSLEAGKHENQLFISIWNRETGKLRGFGSTSALKMDFFLVILYFPLVNRLSIY